MLFRIHCEVYLVVAMQTPELKGRFVQKLKGVVEVVAAKFVVAAVDYGVRAAGVGAVVLEIGNADCVEGF